MLGEECEVGLGLDRPRQLRRDGTTRNTTKRARWERGTTVGWGRGKKAAAKRARWERNYELHDETCRV